MTLDRQILRLALPNLISAVYAACQHAATKGASGVKDVGFGAPAAVFQAQEKMTLLIEMICLDDEDWRCFQKAIVESTRSQHQTEWLGFLMNLTLCGVSAMSSPLSENIDPTVKILSIQRRVASIIDADQQETNLISGLAIVAFDNTEKIKKSRQVDQTGAFGYYTQPKMTVRDLHDLHIMVQRFEQHVCNKIPKGNEVWMDHYQLGGVDNGESFFDDLGHIENGSLMYEQQERQNAAGQNPMYLTSINYPSTGLVDESEDVAVEQDAVERGDDGTSMSDNGEEGSRDQYYPRDTGYNDSDGSDDEDSGTYDSPNDTKKRKRGRKKKGKKKREKRKKKRKKGKKKRKGKKKVEGTDSDDEELPAKMVIAGVEGISSEGERDNHYEGDSFEDENQTLRYVV